MNDHHATPGNGRHRARTLGIVVGTLPTGPLNAITDVEGVLVGHTTLDDGADLHTGVTAVVPRQLTRHALPAAVHTGNGYGKLVGSTQIDELGVLESPIVLTATLSVFRAADALLTYLMRMHPDGLSFNPVVGETNDGHLSDIRRRPITEQHVLEALDGASGGLPAEGCVGAGTGTTALGFKAGIGTSSRRLLVNGTPITVGALVQSNFGGLLTLQGTPIPPPNLLPTPEPAKAAGRLPPAGQDEPTGRLPEADHAERIDHLPEADHGGPAGGVPDAGATEPADGLSPDCLGEPAGRVPEGGQGEPDANSSPTGQGEPTSRIPEGGPAEPTDGFSPADQGEAAGSVPAAGQGGRLPASDHGERPRRLPEAGQGEPADGVPEGGQGEPDGNSCMIVVATDAPLDARRLGRLARRAIFAMGRVGASYAHGSGDYAIAFSTASPHLPLLADAYLNPVFAAVMDAVEEALLNSLLTATTTTGVHGRTSHALPYDRLPATSPTPEPATTKPASPPATEPATEPAASETELETAPTAPGSESATEPAAPKTESETTHSETESEPESEPESETTHSETESEPESETAPGSASATEPAVPETESEPDAETDASETVTPDTRKGA